MEITYCNIKKIAIAYITIPVIIFILGWIKLHIAIPVVALLLIALWKGIYNKKSQKSIKDKEENKENKKSIYISKKMILLIFGIAFGWCLFSGQGGFFPQSDDYPWRNAILRDLINFDWPVVYSEFNRTLVYYIGHWMVPGLFGKMALGITNSSNIAWIVGNITLLIWTSIGATIVLLLLIKLLKCDSRKKIFITILMMIFFSGLDFIGTMITGRYDAMHIEWWVRGLQFSSITTCLFWVFNQSIIPWIITLIVLQEKNVKNYAFLIVICLLSGPFPTVGIAIYMVVLGIIELIKHIKNKQFKEFILDVFSIQNIVAILLILPIFILYLTSNSAASMGVKISLGTIEEGVTYFTLIQRYILFIILELGVYAAFIFKDNKRNPIYYTTIAYLIIVPLIKMGESSDFCMRVSIPGVLILMCLIIKYLFDNIEIKKKTCTVLIILLCIGAATPFIEMRRSVVQLNDNNIVNVKDTIGTFNQEEVRLIDNFVANDYQEKTFYKYLAK